MQTRKAKDKMSATSLVGLCDIVDPVVLMLSMRQTILFAGNILEIHI